MTKCHSCGFESDYPQGYRRTFCDNCVKDKEIGITKVLGYMDLPGYGKVLNSRIAEMERRVIIKDNLDSTGYHCGRLGENGKIQERTPNY